MAFKILSREEASTLMRLAKDYHGGKRELPPEIVAKKREIESETRRAELFVAVLGVIDHGMVNHVVRLKLELDGLYAAWAESETSSSSASDSN